MDKINWRFIFWRTIQVGAFFIGYLIILLGMDAMKGIPLINNWQLNLQFCPSLFLAFIFVGLWMVCIEEVEQAKNK